MIQSFDDVDHGEASVDRLRALRGALATENLDGMIIPHEDPWLNEVVAPAFDRLHWLTGFTGSGGAAVVLAKQAAIFVDHRYALQIQRQVDRDLFEYRDLLGDGIGLYLSENATGLSRIGFDPYLHSFADYNRWKHTAGSAGFSFEALQPNPIDVLWTNRPNDARGIISPYISYTGESSQSKRDRLAKQLRRQNIDAALIAAPTSIAWLFNVRAPGTARTPAPLCSAMLFADASAAIVAAPANISADLCEWLGPQVRFIEEDAQEKLLIGLAGKSILFDPDLTNVAQVLSLQRHGAKVITGTDPVLLPRAIKNTAEVEGARSAHILDGVALCQFLHWLDTEAQDGETTEIEACETLENFRSETGALMDLAFGTIAAAGDNAAIVHYGVTRRTNRRLARGSLFLCDSGAQYVGGTTDVTRTVAIGSPTEEHRDRFTRVLKGHIALARLKFPQGTSGHQIDALARVSLWEAGLDYDHSTGHGVGVYLSGHEGPQRISKTPNSFALEPGMLLSNEPGYYKVGAYGIRIENVLAVHLADVIAGGERTMLEFETLTLAPIARALIIPEMLSADDQAWLNKYHNRVYQEIGPHLDLRTRHWLEGACAPLCWSNQYQSSPNRSTAKPKKEWL